MIVIEKKEWKEILELIEQHIIDRALAEEY